MKILLFTPINRSYVIMPSLGLGYLASQIRKKGHQVIILDCLKEKMDFAKFAQYIKEVSPQLIGFQMYSYDFNPAKKHIEIIKSLLPYCKIVAGGAHPSGDPEGILEYLPDLDFAFKGEAEAGFPILVDRLDASNSTQSVNFSDIPGLIWRDDGGIRVNPPRYCANLDDLDYPAWDLIRPETYPEAGHGAFARNFPTAPIIITRGCPFRCTFCAGHSVSGGKFRSRSIDNVIAEMEYLSKDFGVKEFLIEDENLTLHQKLTYEFCEKILSSSIKDISWSCPSGIRIDTLDLELIRKMEEAGCYSVALGIEFGTQRMLDLTKKSLTLEIIEEKIALFSQTNIKTTGFFMLGVPGENMEDMRQTMKFALKLRIDRAQFNNFMPLPGSELCNNLKEQNLLQDIDWDHFFVHDVAWVGAGYSRRELKNLQRKAYLRFYLRPHILFNIAKEIKNPRHLKYLLKRVIDSFS